MLSEALGTTFNQHVITMKIFISWSGNRSKKVAELLKNWIKCVIQAVDPWISSRDIDRGSIWFSEINSQLSETNNGIVCLTKANLEKPWILFESGALAKGLNHSRVYTFLIDLESNDVKDPLAQFNHTLPTKESLYALIRSLNNSQETNVLSDALLQNIFETFYPEFELKFNKIIAETIEEELPKKDFTQKEFLDEILYTVRVVDKRIRKLEEAEDKKPVIQPYLNITEFRLKDPLTSSIAEMNLSVRAYNTLKSFRIDTIKELLSFNFDFIENEKIKREIKEKAGEYRGYLDGSQ